MKAFSQKWLLYTTAITLFLFCSISKSQELLDFTDSYDSNDDLDDVYYHLYQKSNELELIDTNIANNQDEKLNTLFSTLENKLQAVKPASDITKVSTVDKQWLYTSFKNYTFKLFNTKLIRLSLHVTTDKYLYQPRDIVFIEVLILNAFNNTPVQIQPFTKIVNSTTNTTVVKSEIDDNFVEATKKGAASSSKKSPTKPTPSKTPPQTYNLYLQIYNGENQLVYTDYNYAYNSSVVFNYKVPMNATGGIYMIQVYNQSVAITREYFIVQSTIKTASAVGIKRINVNNYMNSDYLEIGDTISGKIDISIEFFNSPSLSSFSLTSILICQLQINFGSQIIKQNIQISTNGVGYYQFTVPNTSLTFTQMVFQVTYQKQVMVDKKMVNIKNPEAMMIEFYPETGFIACNTTNRVFFQAFANANRQDPFTFSSAQLKETTRNKTTLLASSISSNTFGRGQFQFNPSCNLSSTYTLIIPYYKSKQKYQLERDFDTSPFYKNISEISFKILNYDSININGTIQLQFNTNKMPNLTQNVYIVMIRLKERIVYLDEMKFLQNINANYVISLKQNQNNIYNYTAGVYTVSLYQLHPQFITYYNTTLSKNVKLSELLMESIDEMQMEYENQLNDIGFDLILNDYLQQKVTASSKSTTSSSKSSSSSSSVTTSSSSSKTSSSSSKITASSSSKKPSSSSSGKQSSSSSSKKGTTKPSIMTNILNWLIPKGDIELFIQPSSNYIVKIETDKSQYMIGDKVNFQAKLYNSKSKQLYQDGHISLTISTSDQMTHLHSLDQSIYLQSHILSNDHLNMSDYEDIYLSLNTQPFNQNYFSLYYQQYLNNATFNKSAKAGEKIIVQNLYDYPFSYFNQKNNKLKVPIIQSNYSQSSEYLQEQMIYSQLKLKSAIDTYGQIALNQRFYNHQLRDKYTVNNQQADQSQTVYFQSHAMFLNGSFNGSFYCNDITNQKYTAKGHLVIDNDVVSIPDIEGILETIDPITVSFSDIVRYANVNETFIVNVIIVNNMEQNISVTIINTIANSIQLISQVPQQMPIKLLPKQKIQIVETYQAIYPDDSSYIQIIANASIVIASNQQSFYLSNPSILNMGIVSQYIKSSVFNTSMIGGVTSQSSIIPQLIVNLPKSYQNGSLTVKAQLKMSVFSICEDAFNSINEELPTMSFETLVSLSYLKSMAMHELQENLKDIADYKQYELYQQLGQLYSKFNGYLLKDNGYEWFGMNSSHESLTSYAVLVLNQMNSVIMKYNSLNSQNNQFYFEVDQILISKNVKFLNSKRTKQGGYILSLDTAGTYGRPSPQVSASFILWSLSSASYQILPKDIQMFMQNVTLQVNRKKADSYTMALLASTLFNTNNNDDAMKFAWMLTAFQESSGLVGNASTSITMSKGLNLDVEVTAIACIAWMNDYLAFQNQVNNGIQWIISNIQGGRIRSSLATALAVQAISQFYSINYYQNTGFKGIVGFYINSTLVATESFTDNTIDSIEFKVNPIVNKSLANSTTYVSVALLNITKTNLNSCYFSAIVSIQASYYGEVPIVSKSQSLSFTSQRVFKGKVLGNKTFNNQTFQYILSIKNLLSISQSVIVIHVSIPSCLMIKYAFLDQLVKNSVADAYEFSEDGSELTLYKRYMQANQLTSFNLNFIQEKVTMNGNCIQRPIIVYQYYNDDSQLISLGY